MSDIKIFVSSPLGFSEVGREFMYSKLIPEIEKLGYEVIDPWVLTPQEMVDKVIAMPYGPEKRDEWQRVSMIIGKNNEKGLCRPREPSASVREKRCPYLSTGNDGYIFECRD